MPGVDIQDFVSKLRCCGETDFVNVLRVHQLVRENPLDPKSIEKYLIWDRQHYTRNLIDKTSLFEVMAICWDVGQVSNIHNHKDQNCWMTVPMGRLLIQNYRVIDQDLNAGTCDLEPTDLVEMNPSNPCAVDRRIPCTRSTTHRSSISVRSACTCIPVPTRAALSIRTSLISAVRLN